MKLICMTPTKALNKAYLKESIKREELERFKANLVTLFERIKPGESEEHLKNLLADFLKDTWYKPAYEINTSGRTDLVIHNGAASSAPVGVLFEVKRPDNTTEMISPEKPNTKALHELLSYYLNERYLKENKELKRLIVCNIYEWYIFDAADFERFFFANKQLVLGYKQWKEGLFGLDKTDWFYRELAKPFIEQELTELPCTVVHLKEFVRIARKPDSAEERRLVTLYKLLSPQHLLKLPFANDSNLLNREFYGELLHLIGLEEVKEKGKKLIRRKSAERRNEGSLLENAIAILKARRRLDALPHPEQYGTGEEEQLFSVALELSITWLNRLLFLKLLEGQLVLWHRGDRRQAFLNSSRVGDFDELNELFFDVLAVRPQERGTEVQAKFGAIPYLNSSLFEESELERATLRINELKNRLNLPLYPATVLKDGSGKRLGGEKNTLGYLFEFLDAYDFASEGSAEIQEQNKTLINASVLGLIFEKINGYRDGSFFTPGFITMYMSRETIRRAVLQKFRDSTLPNLQGAKSFEDLRDRLDAHDREIRGAANALVDDLKICDPAVGSGHFLVSALNELIAVKSELGILSYRDGSRVKEFSLCIENDELIVVDRETDQPFAYQLNQNGKPFPALQKLQEALFHEKAAIIENCLFGVDINPKSVAICRLRLWIELLKNAYYTEASGYTALETLPNIDINIKCGNSLVSRFALTGAPNVLPADRKKLKELTERYRRHVFDYKLSPANKAQLRKVIDNLKEDLQNFGLPNDKDLAALRRKQFDLAQLPLFAYDKKEAAARKKLQEEVEALEKRFAEKQRSIYFNAFEWRFEFPEVLDENGEFIGFDVVIGNPPYIRQEAIKEQKSAFMEMFGTFYCGTADIYTYFYKTGLNLLKTGGSLCYIAPNKFMRAGYGKNTRELLTSLARPLLVLDFGDLPIFEEATTYPSIVLAEKLPVVGATVGRRNASSGSSTEHNSRFFAATFTDAKQLTRFADDLPTIGFFMPVSDLSLDGWSLEPLVNRRLLEKICSIGVPLKDFVGERVYRGITTGFNDAFEINEAEQKQLIAEDSRSAEIIKPFLRGRDVLRWNLKQKNTYLIFTQRGIDIDNYPAIKKHLEKSKKRLLPKPNNWDEKENGEWPGRKSGSYKWYEIQDNIAYHEKFNNTKIVSTKISLNPTFSLDTSGSYLGNTSYFFAVKSFGSYLLALLNSNVFEFYSRNVFVGKQNGYYEVQPEGLEAFAVPEASGEQQNAISTLADQILAAKATNPQADTSALEGEIDALVYQLYGLTPEEIAIVEQGTTRGGGTS